jgi:16S rRNA (guanine527-N7)-methyltransferase
MDLIQSYFPNLSSKQLDIFSGMKDVYAFWNEKINVISRKDFDQFYLHHVLHALAIAKFVSLSKGTKLIDVGTGGGFPGIPLSVFFPETEFVLMDSIRKKILVVDEVIKALSLDNVCTLNERAENHHGKYHYVTAKAVTNLPDFKHLTKHLIKTNTKFGNEGLYYLKGGDFNEELCTFKSYKLWNINEVFPESYFETKKLLFIPAKKYAF